MTVIDTLRLDLPAPWEEMPLDDSGLQRLLSGAEASPEWATLSVQDRRRIELFMRRFAADVASAGVVFAGVYSVMLGEDEIGDPAPDNDAPERVTMASAIMSVLTSATIGTDLPLTPHVLQAALSLQRDDQAVLATSRTTALEPPAIIQLDCGPTVRVRQLVEQTIGREKVRFYTASFFVGMPDTPDTAVVLQFATPHVAESEVFAEYFETLCNTLRFYREGEETTL